MHLLSQTVCAVSESCCSSRAHRAALFQELLCRRTSIPLHNQELLYEGRRLVLDANRQAKTFPKTSRENPIMLVSRESVATVGLIFEDRMPVLFFSSVMFNKTRIDVMGFVMGYVG